MIYGEALHEDGRPVLNTRWPQRHLFKVFGTSSGKDIEVYVWDDNFSDAIESAAEWGGEEGDDDNLYGFEIRDSLYSAIKVTTDKANAEPPQEP